MPKRKNKKGHIILDIVIFVSFLCFIYSSLDIYRWVNNVYKSNHIKSKLNKKVSFNNKKVVIDFKSLKKENPDTVGYLIVKNTKINYVVVKSSDNSYYLSHSFNKTKNISGWVFMDYRNKLDETDKNIIIYGHNMKDGSMFGELRKTLTNEWLDDKKNHEIVFITEKREYKYRVFSVYTTVKEDYYLNTEFDDEFLSFKKELLSRSIYDFKTNISTSNNILTLSTCSGNGDKRVVLHAIKK